MSLEKEKIVLLSEALEPIGEAPKLASHHENTPLHLAFSCYIFNEVGEFLLTQRALSKKVWPGVWTNSVCGHPAPGESMTDAIKRRLKDELGMGAKDFELILPDYRYKTPPFKGIVENEFCPVYVAKAVSDPQPNPEEVEAYEWVTWSKLEAMVQQDPEKYSYWFKDQLKQLKNKLQES